MLDALLMALTALASPERLGYMALGVLIGYAIGVLPALGGLAGLSLVMPFIYGLDQVSALPCWSAWSRWRRRRILSAPS